MLARTLTSLAAGVVLAGAFEPLAWPWLAPLAVAALVVATDGLRARGGALVGGAFGLGFTLVLLVWMRVVGPDAWVLVSLIETSYFVVLGAVLPLARRVPGPPVAGAAVAAACWLAAETVRSSWPFGGFPWGRLAFATIDTPVQDAVAWVGTSGASFLLALAGTGLGWALLSPTVRDGARALVVPAGALAVAALPALVPTSVLLGEADGTARIAAVQGDVPGDGDDILLDSRQVTANHVEATVELAERVARGEVEAPDLVVWPENSTATDPFRDPGIREGVETAVAAIDRPVLVGAIVDAPEPEVVLNQGVVWDPVTGPGDRYTKWHPVPFGEYIPFRNSFITSQVSRLDLVPRDMAAGTREQPLRVGDVQVAGAICFDVAYDDGLYAQVREGAQVVVVQTSNAMFIRTDQIDQQFAISRLRAIETGRYVVVAAVNGVSGVVAPDGSVVAVAEPRTRAVLLEEVALHERTTPAVHVGPWIGRAALAAPVLLVVLAVARRGRRGDGAGPAAAPAPPAPAAEPAA